MDLLGNTSPDTYMWQSSDASFLSPNPSDDFRLHLKKQSLWNPPKKKHKKKIEGVQERSKGWKKKSALKQLWKSFWLLLLNLCSNYLAIWHMVSYKFMCSCKCVDVSRVKLLSKITHFLICTHTQDQASSLEQWDLVYSLHSLVAYSNINSGETHWTLCVREGLSVLLLTFFCVFSSLIIMICILNMSP